jgi:hypothetical protein
MEHSRNSSLSIGALLEALHCRLDLANELSIELSVSCPTAPAHPRSRSSSMTPAWLRPRSRLTPPPSKSRRPAKLQFSLSQLCRRRLLPGDVVRANSAVSSFFPSRALYHEFLLPRTSSSTSFFFPALAPP